MELNLVDEETFIPTFNGNQEEAAGAQILIVYRVPTESMKRRLVPRQHFKFNYDAEGTVKGGEVEVGIDQRPVIDGMLIRIKNLSWKDQRNKVHDVIDSKTLFDAPVQIGPLVDEIFNHFKEKLEEKLPEKN